MSTSSTTPTDRRSCARTSPTPRTSTACSPGSTQSDGTYDTSTWGYAGDSVASPSAGQRDSWDEGGAASDRDVASSAARREPRIGRSRRPTTIRRATRPWNTRAACSRCSSGTSPGTRPRWCTRCAAYRPSCSPGCAMRSPPTPVANAPRRSPTRWAGPNTPPACRPSGRPRSCSCCSATSGDRAEGSWRCAATRRSRDRPTSRRCSTSFPATSRCRTPTCTRTSTTSSPPTRPTPGSGAR